MEDRGLWEYRVQSVGFALRSPKDEEIEAVLNEWGQEGWELVEVIVPTNSTRYKLIGRRPLSRSTRRQRSWAG